MKVSVPGRWETPTRTKKSSWPWKLPTSCKESADTRKMESYISKSLNAKADVLPFCIHMTPSIEGVTMGYASS